MKKICFKLCACVMIMAVLVACSSGKDPFEKKAITAFELQEKLDNKESFVLMIEKENCPFCESIDEYLEQTKKEHPGVVIYTLDTSEFAFQRQEDGKLKSDTEEGKILLDMAPYFLYTPTIYKVTEGVASDVGIGFDETSGAVSLWDLDSMVDFETAESMNVWEFIEK